jgi:EAL domain-containing protein (putative c-di-GMP-specific phosphodiesterase class I)
VKSPLLGGGALYACHQVASWLGGPASAVSINVSAVQIEAETVAIDVADALRESGLPPSRLQIELTESAFAGDRRNIIPDLVQSDTPR